MSRLRVLCLTSEYPPRVGGVATHVYELTRALRAEGLSVTVVAPPWPGAADEDAGTRRYSPLIRAQPFHDVLLARWCRHLLRAQPVDLIHVHGLRPLRPALATGLPVVFTNHTSGFLKTLAGGGPRLARLGRLLAGCAHILAPSEELAEASRRAGYQGPVTYLPNGVDAQRFAPGSAPAVRAVWGAQPTDVVAVIARRLVAKNGVVIAAQALAQTMPDVRFVFVGEGAERAAIAGILARDGSEGRALLAGEAPNTAMPEIYRAADLALLPSLMEATSIAGLEAMACGLPLIGSAVGGIPALIGAGINGLLVPPSNPAALAEAVNALARDPARRIAMGAASRAAVLRQFTWQGIAQQTAAVFEAVVAQRRALPLDSSR